MSEEMNIQEQVDYAEELMTEGGRSGYSGEDGKPLPYSEITDEFLLKAAIPILQGFRIKSIKAGGPDVVDLMRCNLLIKNIAKRVGLEWREEKTDDGNVYMKGFWDPQIEAYIGTTDPNPFGDEIE
jgi:hypothetical protein